MQEGMPNKDGLCEAEVRKNLVLAEIGQPLTLPLARLNKSCEFKKEWDRIQDKWHGEAEDVILKKIEEKAKRKAYNQTPEVKAKRKAYNQTPEAKAKKKDYYKTPEVKAKRKAYYKTPEVKAKMKAYNQTPEAKAKKKDYDKKRRVFMKAARRGDLG